MHEEVVKRLDMDERSSWNEHHDIPQTYILQSVCPVHYWSEYQKVLQCCVPAEAPGRKKVVVKLTFKCRIL